MSLMGSIFNADLMRQAKENPHAATLIGRPIVDPVAREEANFFLDHGTTKAQFAERARILERENFENRAVSDLVYDAPPEDICNTKGLGPKRARYARYFEWRWQENKKLANLESKKAYLESLIDAPKATEAAIRKEISQTAAFLMGRDMCNGGDNGKRRVLDDRLASERHAADAAREALSKIEQDLEIARLRTAALDARETEFIKPAIIEIADEIGLGELYLKKARELREVVELVNGLSDVAREFGTFGGLEAKTKGGEPFESAEVVRLPLPPLPSISSAASADLYIQRTANTVPWNQLKQSLILDPRHNAKHCIALPK